MKHGPKVMGVAEPEVVLMRAGIVLFLLGLITGFAISGFAIPRLGLASHLEGVMNGMFLMILGAIWPRLDLSRCLGTIAFASATYGTYANWAATLLGAIWGAGALMPIASANATAAPAFEAIVTGLLVSLSLAMVLAALLILWGLRSVPSDGAS